MVGLTWQTVRKQSVYQWHPDTPNYGANHNVGGLDTGYCDQLAAIFQEVGYSNEPLAERL